ncbi:MAG TPA: hypothetical protein VIQ00_02120 [Chitinophagaceae bacterium]
MSNDLEIINDILYLHLRPWKTHYSGQKYQQMMQTVNNETYRQQPLYGIDFIKPLTAKTKYYHALIEQKLIRYLNSVHLSMANAINENEKKYWIDAALEKALKPKFKAVQKRVLKNNYLFDLVDPKSRNRSNDVTFRDEAYIIQLIKYKLICLYLEIQDSYLPYLKEDPITEEEIHSTYFTEPFQTFIKTAPDVGLPNAPIQITPITDKKIFTPFEGDFRPIKKGILSYKQIISNPVLFASFEVKLFEVQLIDHNYNYYGKHGEKQKLAAIYWALIHRRYFTQRNFNKLRNIKPIEVCKFLDYRYNTDLEVQFRAWGRSPEKLAEYLKLMPWLNQLPLS